MEFSPRKLFIMSAPSGSGKTTIFKYARQVISNLTLSVSYTTRKPRPGEEDGKDYFFIDEDRFRKMIDEDRFLEWAKVHNYYYGTSKEHVKKIQKEGKLVVLDVDVQGAMQIKQLEVPDTVYLFILPPSIEALEQRLKARATENAVDLSTRLENARQEMEYKDQYDYVIINDDLETAVRAFTRSVLIEAVDLEKTPLSDIEDFVQDIVVR